MTMNANKGGLIYLVATGGGVTFGGGEPGLQSKFRNLEKFAMDDFISTWKPL